MSKARRSSRGRAGAGRQGQEKAQSSAAAARYLEMENSELVARMKQATEAAAAVSDLDAGRRTDAEEVARLASAVLGEDCVLEDMVDREMIRSALIHVQRICEAALRIREIRRKKDFTQNAVQLLFDDTKKAQPAAGWQSLFGAR